MVTKKSKKNVESFFIRARILSKEDSPENSSICDGPKACFSDVKTGHCTPNTGHKVKEIGPDGQ